MSLSISYPPRLLTSPNAARYLGISESTLRGLNLPRRNIGAKRLHDKADLDAFADALPYDERNGPKETETNTCDSTFGVKT